MKRLKNKQRLRCKIYTIYVCIFNQKNYTFLYLNILSRVTRENASQLSNTPTQEHGAPTPNRPYQLKVLVVSAFITLSRLTMQETLLHFTQQSMVYPRKNSQQKLVLLASISSSSLAFTTVVAKTVPMQPKDSLYFEEVQKQEFDNPGTI